MSLAAGPQQAPERLPFDTGTLRPARAGDRGVWLFAALLLVVAVGLGYYAHVLRGAQAETNARLASANRELVELRAQTKSKDAQLSALEGQATELGNRYAESQAQLEERGAELTIANTRLAELDAERGEIEEQLGEFKRMTRELSRMIDTGKLQVTFRRGRMIVALPSQVLFPSGSADLSPEGREALTQVAKSLRGFKSRHFIVAGHTDNVPVAAKFASNWELSSARAVNVTEELIRGGLRPEQLVAAGYGEHDPVARNTSEANKQKNRRIEIILEPRLRELPATEREAAKKSGAKGQAATKLAALGKK